MCRFGYGRQLSGLLRLILSSVPVQPVREVRALRL
jgi:hypothetical protein